MPGKGDDAATAEVRALLTKPISADEAVQIALLNNPGLKVRLAELHIAEADLVQAGRLRNPGFAFTQLQKGSEITLEHTVTLDILGLLVIPLKVDLEARRFEQAQLGAAADVLKLAMETRRAYFRAVAAQESLAYFEKVKTAAETGAELARRMAQVGNWSRLAQMREQLFYAEATGQFARAKQTAVVERERLTRMMGLWGSDIGFKLPERLPGLPPKAIERAEVEATAVRNRLEVQMARQEVAGMAKSIGLARATRLVNVLDFGYRYNTSNEGPRQTGYEINIQVPIFDWGDAKLARAEASYRQAVNRTAEAAINARSEAREAYQTYRTAFDIARHYRDEILPLRNKISDEQLLRYNGMLIGVFELIADAREQVECVRGYIDALRDYWIAETDLQGALSGPIGAAMQEPAQSPSMPAAIHNRQRPEEKQW